MKYGQGEGILSCDEEGRILDASPLACVFTRLQREALVSHRLDEIEPGLARAQRLLNEIPGLRAVEVDGELFFGRELHRPLRLRLVGSNGTGVRTIQVRPARRRAADELPEDPGFVRALLDASPMLVAAADAQGRVVLFNRACERLTGRAFEEVRGKPFWDVLLHPGDRDEARDVFLRTTPERFPRLHQSDWLTRAGERRRIEWTNDALLDDGGRLRAFLSVGREATLEKRDRDARHTLAALIDCSVDAFVGLSRDGTIEAWNDAAERTFGFPGREVLGRPVVSLAAPGQEAVLKSLVDQAFSGRCVEQGETMWRRRDGARRDVVLSASPVRDSAGAAVACAMLVRDVTDLREAERALRRTCDMLSEAETLAGLGSWEWDVDQDRVSWSPELYRIFGAAPETVVRGAQDYLARVHPEDRERVGRMLRSAAERPGLFEHEARILRPDGRVRQLRSRGRSFADAGGRVRRMIGTCQDVTEERERADTLRDSEARLRLLLRQLPIAVWTVDRESRVTSCAGRLYGTGPMPPAETLLGRRQAELFPPGHAGLEAHRDALRGDPGTYETTYGDRTFKVYVEPLRSEAEAIIGAVGAAIDVTERQRAETLLRELNLTLEARVRARTRELEAALLELNAFAYSVSHDLRAPLRAMHGIGDLLLQEYEGRVLDEGGVDYLRRIREAARRMDGLIQDLLLYSRLGQGEIPLEPVDVLAAAREAVVQIRGFLEERKARVNIAGEAVRARANRLFLSQAVTNLVSNAAKFVAPGTLPEIDIRVGVEDDRIVISVRDNGIGIPPEHHERIFGIFQQLNPRESYPGTGIGLAIVRRVVTRMGGGVRVESEPGRGSCFRIELPRDVSGGSE